MLISLPIQYGPKAPRHIRRRAKYRSIGAALLAFERKPESAMELYHRADKLDETDLPEAERLYRRAIEQDPTMAIAWTNLGNVRFRQHDSGGAQTAYEQALRLDPNQPEAAYNLGYLGLERGDYDAAIPLFQRSIAHDRDFADAWFNLGMAYWQRLQGSLDAVRCFRVYLTLTAQTTDRQEKTWREIARRHLA